MSRFAARLVEKVRIYIYVRRLRTVGQLFYTALSSALVNYSLQSDIRYTSLGGSVEANGILNPAWALKFALML